MFPFFLINLLMGLTPMRAATFYGISQVGMLAGTRGEGSFEGVSWDDALAAAVAAISGADPERVGIVANDSHGLTGASYNFV